MAWVHGLAADFKLAARRLLATPLFTLFAALSLAIGVGVTTAGYSAIDAILLSDLGIGDPDEVGFVVTPYDGRLPKALISQPDFEHLRAAQRSFRGLSASASFRPVLATAARTERVTAEAVDGAYFQTFGVTVAIGRPIQVADDAGGARVAVVSHRHWRARFASDPKIVGQIVRLSGHPFEIIGVAAASFDGANGAVPGTKLWIPLSAEASIRTSEPSADSSSAAGDRSRLVVFGRLASPATVAMASAELAAIAANLDTAFPLPARANAVPAERRWRVNSVAAIAEENNALRRFGLTLVALVALVLVVACTNLANLVLARGTTRLQEFTIRRALGAPRWRLVREQCAESALLAVGGAVAAALVFQFLRVLMDVEFQLPLVFGEQWSLPIQPSLNLAALVTAAALLLISLLVFGLEPALQLTRPCDIRGALAANAGGVGTARPRRQRILLRWQVAISAGFFIVATMFLKYTIAEARHDSGVALERLGVALLNFQAQQWDDERVRRTVERALEDARTDPAVESVSASTSMPFGGGNSMRLSLWLPDKAIDTRNDYHAASGFRATPSIFQTLGVPILRGRGFDERDRGASVVVLSAFAARTLFGSIDAVGRHVVVRSQASPPPIATVIGVARDTDVGRILGEPRPLVYLPLPERGNPTLIIAARSSGDATLAVRALGDALRRADPDLAVDVIGTGRAMLAGPFVFLRALGTGTLALGAMTLLLAMVGLFGIQSHHVAHRTREIGVRMSFGATASQIERMVLLDGYRPVFDGLVLGLAGGLAGRVIVRAYMDIDVTVIDPWMLLVVPIPVILSAFCACYLPAHRAAAIDPNVALRQL